MSGRGAPQGRGGAATGGGEGKSEEGGVGAFHTGNHTGQQPPGHTNGQCAGHRGGGTREVDHKLFTLSSHSLTTPLPFYPQPKAATLPAPQTSSSTSSSSSQPYNSSISADPVNSASALKTRPASIMATKGKVLQKAKVSLKEAHVHQWNKIFHFHAAHTCVFQQV